MEHAERDWWGRQGGELNTVWEVHVKSIRHKVVLQHDQVERELNECIGLFNYSKN